MFRTRPKEVGKPRQIRRFSLERVQRSTDTYSQGRSLSGARVLPFCFLGLGLSNVDDKSTMPSREYGQMARKDRRCIVHRYLLPW